MAAPQCEETDFKTAKSIYEFTAKDLSGNEVNLDKYKGHVCLIVNVASECGYTDVNYEDLQQLCDQYSESKGLRILAFPCNQFGEQEPGNSDQIACFVKERKVKFDVFEKCDVNGANAHPLWKFLKYKHGGNLRNFIKWNFTKFIVDKRGVPIERFAPSVEPMKMIEDLEKYW